ncbi:MAG: hypothetical protein GY940_30915, partial [bacterium]|nr:hypothetical protein [bacterium]
EKDGQRDVLLYDYLMEKLAEETGTTPLPEDNHRFLNMALKFLKKYHNDYLKLSKFLNNLVNDVTLTTANPLWKLARIKSFRLFINTGYDDFLTNTISTVRDYPTTPLNHTLNEKKFNKMTDSLFDAMDNQQATLVYNIFGNFGKHKNIQPAYTEKDILETIVEFQRDMKDNRENNLFQQLESGSLLFMGCGYDDWLFRFFIRTVANEP